MEPQNQIISDEIATYQHLCDKHWMEIRITDLDGTVTPEKVKEWCVTQSPSYFGGEETAKNHHYHLAIPFEILPKMCELRDSLYLFFSPPKKGNAFFSSKPVEDIEKYFPYCVKDGLYFSSSDLVEFLEILYELSFEKPLGYKNDLRKYSELFLTGEISSKDLWMKVVDLRGFYDLEFDENKCYRYVNGQIIKKHPELKQRVFNSDKLFSC